MSGNHNPYAMSGPPSASSGSNPYATTGANNNAPAGRYQDPYFGGGSQSSNSGSPFGGGSPFGSRERAAPRQYDDRGRDSPPTPSSQPYQQHGGGREGSLGSGNINYGGTGRQRYQEGSTSSAQGNYGYSQEDLAPHETDRPVRTVAREPEPNRPYNANRSRDRRGMPPPQSGAPPAMPTHSRAAGSGNGSYSNGMNDRFQAQQQQNPRKVKDLEEILRHIKSDWSSMTGEDCVPVKTALQLMDPSSLGLAHKEQDFANTHLDLQNSLQRIVNEHYTDFNSAVGTYHKIQGAIRESQLRVRSLKSGLMGVKGAMLTTRPELRGLAEQSGELDDMIGTLVLIEELKGVPGKLEERVSEKRFLGAVDLLMEGLRGIQRSELQGIGAVTDLRSYFATQEVSLVDILVEELHDHLYLKSPYCQDRWMGRKAGTDEQASREAAANISANIWDRPVYHYLQKLDTKVPMEEDASRNPEADTFYYIHMVVEALNKLGHLEEAVQRIELRMPVELYKVVERTNNEADAKHPRQTNLSAAEDQRKTLSMKSNEARGQVLSDFLWTLYAKFEAIAEGHRVLHEVISGIVARERIAKPAQYTSGFKELWKLYQMEMRSLLHDYLATNSEITSRKGLTANSGADIFSRSHRDRSKKMFNMSKIDDKSKNLKAEEAELDEILKNSVPGLVNKSRSAGIQIAAQTGQESSALGHKLLVEPGVFNMTILLPPCLVFLQRLKDIVPQSAAIPVSTLTSFLDDFLLNVFHPQLEEAVTELSARCFIDIHAFSEESQWTRHSLHPVFKGTVAFISVIRAFSDMLSSIPQDQLFTQLIITQLVVYYDKCHNFYKSIVTRSASTNVTGETSTTKAAAAYAERGDIRDAALELLDGNLTRSARRRANAKETAALLALTKTSPLSSYDIISDPKSVHQLALLHNSMQWLASALAQIRHVEKVQKQSNTPSTKRWTLINDLKPARSSIIGSPQSYLPLTPELAPAFDKTLASFRDLAQKTILTLHIDIRCYVIYQLGRVLRAPDLPERPTSTSGPGHDSIGTAASLDSGMYPFVLQSAPTSASPLIAELTHDMITFDANIRPPVLGESQRRFILRGILQLIDRALILGADRIGVMNTNGVEKLRVDALVLQQNVRGLIAGSFQEKSHVSKSIAGPEGGVVPASSVAAGTTDNTGLGISTSHPPDQPPSEPQPTTTSATANGTTATPPDPSTTTTTATGALPEEETDDWLSPHQDADATLTQSSRYFALFLLGPDAILQHVADSKAAKQDVGFTYDELRTLIELCFSAAIRGPDREESIKAKKRMGDALLKLGENMWDS